MAPKWIETVTGSLDDKRQYKHAKNRIDTLGEPYRTAARACARYLMYYGAMSQGDLIVRMMADLADLWERAAIDGTPVRDIVGTDPVDFAEEFAQAYGGSRWIDKERARLIADIAAAQGQETTP